MKQATAISSVSSNAKGNNNKNNQAPIAVSHEHNNFATAAAEALGANLFPRPN